MHIIKWYSGFVFLWGCLLQVSTPEHTRTGHIDQTQFLDWQSWDLILDLGDLMTTSLEALSDLMWSSLTPLPKTLL